MCWRRRAPTVLLFWGVRGQRRKRKTLASSSSRLTTFSSNITARERLSLPRYAHRNWLNLFAGTYKLTRISFKSLTKNYLMAWLADVLQWQPLGMRQSSASSLQWFFHCCICLPTSLNEHFICRSPATLRPLTPFTRPQTSWASETSASWLKGSGWVESQQSIAWTTGDCHVGCTAESVYITTDLKGIKLLVFS